MGFVHDVRFVMRCPKHYQLVDEQGRGRKAWEISRGNRSWDHRLLWNACRRCHRKVGVVALPVYDHTHLQPLTLAVARPGQGREPWYLLTNEPALSSDYAWRIVLAYARRWQAELSIRFDKCELAFESSRLRRWETQEYSGFFFLAFLTQPRSARYLFLLVPSNWSMEPECPDSTLSLAFRDFSLMAHSPSASFILS